MYRPSDPQKPLFDAGGLLPPQKRARCEKTWAGAFRQHALPILRRVEEEFADLYQPDLGRPNRPVELVLATLILKEMNDLTDEEVLCHLEFDLLWWWALEREVHELHLCQKTLHNFRTALVEKEKSKLAFRRVTDELIAALGLSVGRQRLDSTHFLSNMASLTRLRLFCETIRVFLREAKKLRPKEVEALPRGVLRRHAEEGDYADVRRGESRRRLPVVARDVWRLLQAFEKDEAVAALPERALLKRLFEEQCETKPQVREPEKDEDDWGDGGTPVVVKEPKEIESSSMQSPHDPDATYSGHKGKGYEAQVVETVDNGEKPEIITEIQVTPSCQSDARATVPIVEALGAAGQKPQELVADTSFSGAENAAEVAGLGVNLLSPAVAKGKPMEGVIYGAPAAECPKDAKEAGEWLRQREAAPHFHDRYAIRAGIEATNSELKRAHGMGRLRVRGESRVKLAVYLKALACNVKRALRYWCERALRPEGAATPA